MTECRRCGTAVSGSYARVLGDEDNNVHGCTACCTFEELCAGAAAGKEVTPSA